MLEAQTNGADCRGIEQAWNVWVNHYGPAKSLAERLEDARREEFRRAMISWHQTFASPLGYEQPRTYLIIRKAT